MCSNTDNACGDGDGSAGSGGGGWSPTSNKKAQSKRQRVPKRGPGVAELEKILREQENKTDDDHYHPHMLEGRSQPCFLSNDHSQPLIPITNSVITHLDHNTSTNISQVALPPAPGNGNSTNSNNVNNALLGRCINDIGGGGCCGGSAVFLAEGAFSPKGGNISLPSTALANEYSHSGYLSSHPMRQKKQSTPMINHFNGSGSSSSIPSSFGLCHQIEPPSSQRSYQNYSSMGSQEKVIGVKRPPPPLLPDNSLAGSVYHYQVPPVPSHRYIHDQATSFNRGLGYNLSFTKPMPRDTKWDVPLEFNHLNNHNTEYGKPDGNFFKFVPTSTTATLMPPFETVQHQFPKFDNMLPFQGSIKGSNQMSISAGLDQNKPFYSFLPTKEQMGRKEKLLLSINNGERDKKAGEDDIDLNLKLSTRN